MVKRTIRKAITQNPIYPTVDLRDMVRQHVISRSLACMEKATKRRRHFLKTGQIKKYKQKVCTAVRNFYGKLPLSKNGVPLEVIQVSSFKKNGYRLENVLFDSFPGWQVNATVYVPLNFTPPFPAVVIPVGHSGKQFESYQLPAQFFARCGYIAVVFDPPGQAGEKKPGNDHFIDGVRCYLVGKTSSCYFVADALRCIDYLGTRSDVDLSNGVAMTGVSGGGTTTTLAGLLDDRVSVLGPSCCLSPLADLDISQCYAGCPETHMWRRYAEGIDEIDLLCGAVPKPTLLMAGEFDEVFRVEDTRRLAKEAQEFYKAIGKGDHFEFFVDHAGHCYSLTQARQFVRFMNRWLRNEPDRPIQDLADDVFALDPYEELQCYPSTDVNMRSLTLDQAQELEHTRDPNTKKILNAASAIAGAGGISAVSKGKVGNPFRVWTHFWQQIILQPEEDIELPVTFLYAEKNPTAALLHFDDKHRNQHLYRNGVLAAAIRFLDCKQLGFNIFSVDLRGWGDSSPAMYPYELSGWGGVDRYMAYASAALGDSVMAMRIRDGLASLAYLRSRSEVDTDKIIISGCGLGGIVALHVAAIDRKVHGVVIWDCLVSFKSLLETENYAWPADTFIPNVLLHYDLPELAAALPMSSLVLRPLDGTSVPVSSALLSRLNQDAGREIYLPDSGRKTIVEHIQALYRQ